MSNKKYERLGKGVYQSSTYNIYFSMRQRCLSKSSKVYAHYGGRGIKVCDRWLQSYANFVSDMGERPDGMTLERIDNNGDYSPTNCRWASRKVQANNRRSSHFITANGATKTLQQWSDETGIGHKTILYRLRSGWGADRAVTEKPIIGRNQHYAS